MPPVRRGPQSRGARATPYMTRDAARRLRSAKKAARGVLQGGGTAAEAALAAQAFGTPADGGESGDESDSAQASADDEEDDDDDEVDAAELAAAELSVSAAGAGPSAGAETAASEGGSGGGAPG